MWNLDSEKSLARYLSIGASLVTLFVWTSSGTDPVNVPKLWLAGGIAGAAIAISIGFGGKSLLTNSKLLLILSFFFILAMINSIVNSRAPFAQTFYGVYGRNTGFLTYVILIFFMIAASTIQLTTNLKSILSGILAAGTANVFYCGWVLLFGDFIPWNNQYKSILGTLGNPDFISAFLGFYIVVIFSILLSKTYNLKLKYALSFLSVIALFEIVKSHAIQGLVVTAGGIVIVGFFYLRSKINGNLVPIIYLTASFIFGTFAVLGTLQKGPLSFVYKKSVSLRGSYWHAGLEMGKSHPLSGVGMDTYGDWYRATRPPVAFIDTPPASVVSNVSHNVVIDFFASGGWPLLLSYIAILFLGGYSLIRVVLRTRTYDSTFVGISALWICFEVQSFISINQIGLAVWGWIATGALVAYEKLSVGSKPLEPHKNKNSKRNQGRSPSSVISANLIGGVGLLIGLLLAFPPMNADSKWRAANDSRNLNKLQTALVPSFMNPASSMRYAQAIVILRNSNLNELAMKYANEAVKFNPDNTDAWQQMYLISTATDLERKTALENIKRLDPNNPDLLGNLK
jgi:O-antigen ligase